ncbi:hypothetical protein ABL78_3474 [Leptomonas seymouri]|uniref:Uncharacterized protein n=1 Tax=Leptomonas seymouri TaxID=5684 RepID=A0A0N1I7R0_LEPSE|nr:hypothetical protein ABL78_3474 [Leptomonas seymouri]|eukprot:KPI87443.1 hypothetical protein ABL78_3474 [Leptomonas seymouri]
MEVIHGSIYIEAESVLGIFRSEAIYTAAAPASASPRDGNAIGNGWSCAPAYPTSSSSEAKDDGLAPLLPRAVSSHSPFGAAPSSTSVFTDEFQQLDRAGGHTRVSVKGAKRSKVARRHESFSPGVSTPLYPLPVVEAPCPPSLVVRLAESAHLIDTQSASATSAAGFGGLSPSLTASLLRTSPTTGCAVASTSSDGNSSKGSARRVEASLSLRDCSSFDTARQAGVSMGEAKSCPAWSSWGSLPFPTAAGDAWEVVLDITDDIEGDGADNDSQLTSPVSLTTLQHSFHCGSSSSAAENDDLGCTGGIRGTTRDHLSKSVEASTTRSPMLSYTAYAYPSTSQVVQPRQAPLLWLVEHLANDPSAAAAITSVGLRPHPLSGSSTCDSAVAASSFASAWYACMFPENDDARNVLLSAVHALKAALHGLRRWSPTLTAAVFPLCHCFSFVKVALEVKSWAAFDLQEGMRRAACKANGRHPGQNEDSADAGYLIIRLATPAELKKARKASHRSLSDMRKEEKERGSFFAQVRRSFRGLMSKEKPLGADPRSGGPPQAAPISPFLHPKGDSPCDSHETPPSASSAKSVCAAHTGTAGSKKTMLKGDAFEARLHLPRLLSPLILDWMKKRRAGLQDEEASGEGGAAGCAPGSDGKQDCDVATAGADGTVRDDLDRPAVFCKSVYLPLPPPSEVEDSPCLAMMLKVKVIFRPGFDTAEPF